APLRQIYVVTVQSKQRSSQTKPGIARLLLSAPATAGSCAAPLITICPDLNAFTHARRHTLLPVENPRYPACAEGEANGAIRIATISTTRSPWVSLSSGPSTST